MNPTRGVDVGAKYEIYKIIRKLAKRRQRNHYGFLGKCLSCWEMSDRIGSNVVKADSQGILTRHDANQVEVMRFGNKIYK